MKCGPGNLIGEEDICEMHQEFYSTTVQCISQNSKTLHINKFEFYKL